MYSYTCTSGKATLMIEPSVYSSIAIATTPQLAWAWNYKRETNLWRSAWYTFKWVKKQFSIGQQFREPLIKWIWFMEMNGHARNSKLMKDCILCTAESTICTQGLKCYPENIGGFVSNDWTKGHERPHGRSFILSDIMAIIMHKAEILNEIKICLLM